AHGPSPGIFLGSCSKSSANIFVKKTTCGFKVSTMISENRCFTDPGPLNSVLSRLVSSDKVRFRIQSRWIQNDRAGFESLHGKPKRKAMDLNHRRWIEKRLRQTWIPRSSFRNEAMY